MQNASRVGLLLVIFVGLLAGAWSLLGKSLFPDPKKILYSELADAGGIPVGTRVTMAGVDIGSVEKIELKGSQLAKVTMVLKKDAPVYRGANLVIPSSFISFGTMTVLLESPNTGELLPAGSTIPGKKAGPLDNLLPNGEKAVQELQGVMKEVKVTLQSTQKWLNDDRLRDNLNGLLVTSQETLTKLSDTMTTVVGENRSNVALAVRNLTAASSEINRGTKIVVDLLASGKFQNESLALLKQFRASAEKADQLMGSINGLVNDPALRNNLASTAENVEQMTQSGTRIAASGEKIARNTEIVSEKAIVLADQASELMNEVKGAVQDVNNFLTKAKVGGGGFPKIKTEMDLTRDTYDDQFRVDFMAKLAFGGNAYRFGVYDAFESNKVTAQIGQYLGKRGEFFYGMYAGKPGVGVDYAIAPKWSVVGDLFDINNPRLDLRLRYDFGKGIVGWAGINRAFDKNSPAIGIGIRK
jgi:phospholipid/cholesterol/gamma-HCH transport system substrate-binding protein